MANFDLVVVGAGIVGLAHALAGARRGLRVAVLERDSQAASASVRNFGFVTVSGQDDGETRRRAMRSREVWLEIADEAAIEVHQRGAVIVAQRPEALAVLEEFAAGSMGLGCELWNAEWTRKQMPQLNAKVLGALSSPHELRVEARDALPAIARWLEDRYNVVFAWNTIALAVEGGTVHHATGALEAHAAVIAPGAAIATFAPELARIRDVRHCKLQMMRLARPGFRIPSVVMTDLSLLRYGGFAAQPAARALEAVAQRECGKLLEHGIHLIVAQGADGSLIVGDSHHYADVADAFSSSEVDELILGELRTLFDIPAPNVRERWLGYYPVASVKPVLTTDLAPRARLVSVTSGTGMSTAFAIGEETIASLFG